MKSQFKIILFILVMGSIVSCNKAMRLEKRSEKIAQKAMVDPVAFGIVGCVYIGLHPCPPTKDSIVYGKPDTVITVIPADNDYLFTTIDSLLERKCPTLNVDSLRKATKKKLKPDTVFKDRIVPKTIYQPDMRQINDLTNRNSYLQGSLESSTKTNAELKKDNSKKNLWIIGISIVALIIIGGLVYLLFKPK